MIENLSKYGFQEITATFSSVHSTYNVQILYMFIMDYPPEVSKKQIRLKIGYQFEKLVGPEKEHSNQKNEK